MKSFLASVAVLVLLVIGVILSSTVGIRRIKSYLDAVPEEELSADTADRLDDLGNRVLDDLLLLNSIFPHDRADMLNTAIARTAEAARVGDEVEYAIQRAELLSILDELERDLRPHLADIV